ncbi:MAG: EamA family transporter [Desulforhopalus sp.]|nr:EamA family transporter [Desulforhopalus sp.]
MNLQRNNVNLQAGQKEKTHSLSFIHLLMVIAAALVSTSFTVGAAITAELDPAVLTLVRFSLAACLFGPWVYFKYGLGFSFSLFFRCALISGCLVVFFCSMFLVLCYPSALNISVIFALVPSISGVYALVILGERLHKEQLLALACGVIGVVWVVFRGDLSQLIALEWNRGDVIFLGGCFAIGLYTPLVKLLHREESMAIMTFWVLVTGSLWLLLITGSRLTTVDWAVVPTYAWLGIVYLVVFTTIVTFFLTQYSVSYLGPTRVAAYSYLYPGLVLVIDLVLGHGLPPLGVIPGVFIVLVAMFVLQNMKDD